MRLLFLATFLASYLLLVTSSEDPPKGNDTDIIASFRKDHRQGSSQGGTPTGIQTIQQGIKGIKALQKFVSKLSGVIRLPFSFRGVSDTMATITGLLAAIGGGYLTYVSMVALFGNTLGPEGAVPIHPQPLDPAAAAAYYGQVGQIPQTGPYRRRSGSSLHFGSLDLGKVYESIRKYDFPEASFKMLRIKDDICKQRAVCEFEKFLAKKGIASVILKGVSRKITGMEKYLDAAYRGIANEDCAYAFSTCPHSLGQSLLRSIGLS